MILTYYETLRRKYSLSRPGKSQLRDSIKAGAKNRQRKRRLLESGTRVIKTDAKKELWQTATLELMSDEEDAIVNERPVWVVRSPTSQEPTVDRSLPAASAQIGGEYALRSYTPSAC
ncbi:hypothetical protein IRJ41_009378 [Triplophysa rosa]|uniref:Uncharacterized protein n=1 Tax=Triplophysa rosa TaxID=992332 RepID=A0A9W7T5W9_TRIRA|nr:hypothetical protein IRJ41_009378 [Triplophysa rosa]